MAKRKEKHLFFYKDWFVFPVAIMWKSELMEYIPKASRLTIHFLWWHCRWTFVKREGWE